MLEMKRKAKMQKYLTNDTKQCKESDFSTNQTLSKQWNKSSTNKRDCDQADH